MQYDNLLTMVMMATGAYMIYVAITGKLNLLKLENRSGDQTSFLKNMRIVLGIAGGILLVDNLIILSGLAEGKAVLNWILFALDGAGILILLFVYVKNGGQIRNDGTPSSGTSIGDKARTNTKNRNSKEKQ